MFNSHLSEENHGLKHLMLQKKVQRALKKRAQVFLKTVSH